MAMDTDLRFETELEKSVHQAVIENQLIMQGQSVTVGCSGGADSVALLYCFVLWRERLQLDLHAAHLNHLLRGEESERDESFVWEFCAQHQIPLVVERVDVGALAKQKKQSLEEAARDARYIFLERAAPKGKIVTAHTASDQAETVLFNFIRGTSLAGLGGIPLVRGRIIRPLLYCKREQVEAFCAHYHLDYVTDSTNAELDFTRNRLRHQIIPLIQKINPAFEDATSRLTWMARRDELYLYAQARIAGNAIRTPFGYSIADFNKLDWPRASRLLVFLLRRQKLPYSHDRVLQMMEALRNSRTLQLGANHFLYCSQGYFSVQQKIEATVIAQELSLLDLPQRVVVVREHGKRIRFVAREYEEIENIAKNHEKRLKNLLDCDKISSIVKIRGRKPGDAYRPYGRKHTKTLKDLFNEARLPLWERAQRAVLEAEGSLLWVEGFGVEETFGVGTNTRRAIEISVGD